MEGSDRCASHLGISHGPEPMLTTELTDQLVAMLRAGNMMTVAARAVGISRQVLYKWLDKGREAGAPQLMQDLVLRVERARAEGQVRLVAEISRAAATDWHAAAWLLERTNPEQWSRVLPRPALPTKPPEESETPPTVEDDPFLEVDELAQKRQQRQA
jgi:DNA-binding phage protein